MDLKFSIWLPTWLLPKRWIEDLERRSALSGKASRSFEVGTSSAGAQITMTGEREKSPNEDARNKPS